MAQIFCMLQRHLCTDDPQVTRYLALMFNNWPEQEPWRRFFGCSSFIGCTDDPAQ